MIGAIVITFICVAIFGPLGFVFLFPLIFVSQIMDGVSRR